MSIPSRSSKSGSESSSATASGGLELLGAAVEDWLSWLGPAGCGGSAMLNEGPEVSSFAETCSRAGEIPKGERA